MVFYYNSHGELETKLKFAEARPIIAESMRKLGTVKEAKEDYISGHVTYGFVKVPFRISWIIDSETVVLTIQCTSNDIWNHARNNVLQRIKEVIRNHDNSGYVVDRLGLPKSALFGQVFLFGTFIVIALFLLEKVGL
jgi:hypothetical protein